MADGRIFDVMDLQLISVPDSVSMLRYDHYEVESALSCMSELFNLIIMSLRGTMAEVEKMLSLSRERVCVSIDEENDEHGDFERHVEAVVAHKCLSSPRGSYEVNKADSSNENEGHSQSELSPTRNTARCLIRSVSI